MEGPFGAQSTILASHLNVGREYRLSAVASDLRYPNPEGETATATFGVRAQHCCDGEMNDGETGIDCGPDSGCGLCDGGTCTEDSDCAVGSECENGTCVSLPTIESVSPMAGGAGTLVTVSGRHFGATAGTVEFYNQTHTLTAEPCLEGAWTDTQVTVRVPEGVMVSGEYFLRLTRSDSRRTSTDPADSEARGFLGAFKENGQNLPGICLLKPNEGRSGDGFAIVGDGFGSGAASDLEIGFGLTNPFAFSPSARTETTLTATVPKIPEGIYPVRVSSPADGWFTANNPKFKVLVPLESTMPNIEGLTPTAGPVDSYVTIEGRGFGNQRGRVQFLFGTEGLDTFRYAVGADPVCDDNWKDTYIIIKVPRQYQDCAANQTCPIGSDGVVHGIRVETAGGLKSNTVNFQVNNSLPLTPGICSMNPDNGPPGTSVRTRGENMGTGPATPAPLNAVGYPCQDPNQAGCDIIQTAMSAKVLSWQSLNVESLVPGDPLQMTTWPDSGDVFIWSKNVKSANSLPFLVQNCNDSGAKACPAGYTCCPAGTCDDGTGNLSGRPCDFSRTSEFAWRLSTETLPTPPQVVSCSACGSACPATGGLQSPTPYPNSASACLNAMIEAVISQEISPPTTVPAMVQSCGTGEKAGECQDITDTMIWAVLSAGDGNLGLISLKPKDGALLTANTWYRVSLISGAILESVTGKATALDGDGDGLPGGDYTWTFRTKDSPCALEAVAVVPKAYNIDHWQGQPSPDDSGFRASLQATNCNSLTCSADGYDFVWSVSDPLTVSKVLTADVCYQKVRAERETAVGEKVRLEAKVTPKAETVVSRIGAADLTVRFRDPEVVAYEPNCLSACVNAAIRLEFSTTMEPDSFSVGENVILNTCRNQSCNPPFVTDGATALDGVTWSVGSDGDGYANFELTTDGNLSANTFYQVWVRGGDSGVRSKSGKRLIGTNRTDSDGTDWFVWQFRTNDSKLPCQPTRAEISPLNVLLKYVGQRVPLSVTPFGPPDSCSSTGQALAGNDYPWTWGMAEKNGVVDRFLTAAADGSEALDTASVRPLGCSDRCLKSGSQNSRPQCGNGQVEPGRTVTAGPGAMPGPAGTPDRPAVATVSWGWGRTVRRSMASSRRAAARPA